MTQEQASQLMSLIRRYGSASEDLGSIPGSYGWNQANSKVEQIEKEIKEYIKTLIK